MHFRAQAINLTRSCRRSFARPLYISVPVVLTASVPLRSSFPVCAASHTRQTIAAISRPGSDPASSAQRREQFRQTTAFQGTCSEAACSANDWPMQLRALKTSTRVKQSTPPSRFSCFCLRCQSGTCSRLKTTTKIQSSTRLIFSLRLRRLQPKRVYQLFVRLCQMSDHHTPTVGWFVGFFFLIAKISCDTNKHLQRLCAFE